MHGAQTTGNHLLPTHCLLTQFEAVKFDHKDIMLLDFTAIYLYLTVYVPGNLNLLCFA